VSTQLDIKYIPATISDLNLLPSLHDSLLSQNCHRLKLYTKYYCNIQLHI